MEKNIYNIDKNAHYFVLMHPLEKIVVPYMGFAVCFKSSDSREKWVECVVVEDRYKVDDNYKITLKAIDENYGSETFYQMDFKTALKCGDIVKKTDNNWHIEEEIWYTPLCGAAYIVTSAYKVVYNGD